MKTFKMLVCIALVPAGLGFGQTMAVYDVAVHAQLTAANTNLGSIDGTLTTISKDIAKQLELAKDDTETFEDIKKGVQDTVERLDSLLERIGNPADVQMGDIADYDKVKDQVGNALDDGMKKEREEADPDDDSIFGNDYTENIIKPIGSEFEVTWDKNQNGKPVTESHDRDTQKYVGETEQLKAVQEYYRVRDKAMERREALLEVLADVLEDMKSNSDDFAHLAKQTALVEVIQGQLQVCSNDINNAFNDAAIKGLQVYALNSAKTKADAEPAMFEMEKQKETMESMSDTFTEDIPESSGGSIPAGTSTGGYLPWPNRF